MRRKTIVLLVIIFLAGLIVWGCSTQTAEITATTTTTTTSASTTTTAGEGFFPHADGNSWRYTYSDGSSMIMTFEGMTLINSVTVQKLKSVFDYLSGVYTGESYYKVDATGVYAYSPSTTEVAPFLLFPLEIGKKWIQQTSVSPYGDYVVTYEASIVSKESSTVPAGTFDCYKMTVKSIMNGVVNTTLNYWFGNNAGIIKFNTSSTTVEGQLSWKNF